MATVLRPHLARLARAILAALCVAASGCGAGGDDDAVLNDDAQIEAAVERLMESERVEDQCEVAVSERFVREVYGTLATCRKVNGEDEDSEPDDATTAATRIDGADATTAVTLTSVKGSRASGRIALVRDGETWKVDRLGVDFLRSVFATLHHEAESAHERVVIGCFAEAARAMSDAEVRSFGNQVIGQRLEAGSLPSAVGRCVQRDRPEATIT